MNCFRFSLFIFFGSFLLINSVYSSLMLLFTVSDVPMLSSMAERAVCESINSSSTRSCSHSPSSQQPLSCSQEAFSSEEVAAAFESAAAANGGTTTLLSSSSTASLDIPSVQLSDSSSPDSPSSSLSTSAPPLKKSNRCQHCKKRVGLTGKSVSHSKGRGDSRKDSPILLYAEWKESSRSPS